MTCITILGDQAGAEIGLERALDLAESDGALCPFLLAPGLALLERHPPHRTAHASLITEIRGFLAGIRLAPGLWKYPAAARWPRGPEAARLPRR